MDESDVFYKSLKDKFFCNKCKNTWLEPRPKVSMFISIECPRCESTDVELLQ